MKILIYLDSESYNHPPILMAKIIAQATDAVLHVYIVIPKGGHEENGQAVAEQVKVDLDGLSPKIVLLTGPQSEIIKDAFHKEEYHLIITNADRKRRFRKSVEVDPLFIKQSTISLLLTEKTKPKLEKILLCTGCKENDYSLITQAAGFARDLDASITLTHVFPGAVPTMYTGLDQIEETVEEILQTDTPFAQYLRRGAEILTEFGIHSEVKIRRGIPIEEIVRETQEINYDLVVIGFSKVKDGLKEMFLGNLAVKVIDQIALPVLIIGERDLLNETTVS